jgi:hypothetical protein
MKARMGATHFLMKTLPKVTTEMALSVRARLQSYVGDEHRWRQTANRGDRGMSEALFPAFEGP